MPSITVGPYTIPSAVVESNKDAFLYVNPVPVDENGDPTMGPREWFEEWLRKRMNKELAACRYRYAESQLSYDPGTNEDVVVGE